MIALGRFGFRSRRLAVAERAGATAAAVELEALGFGTFWIPARAVSVRGAELLAATTAAVMASSVASIWEQPAADLAASHRLLSRRFPERVLTGLGISHAPIVEARVGAGLYRRPLAAMERYLDALDAAADPLPATERILAAIGPRMQAVARRRSLGSHPYLVTPAHTREARERLGVEALLAPGVVVVIEDRPEVARELARRHLTAPYLRLPNYAACLRRMGFGDDDLRDRGSDRLVDAIVAWGSPERVAERLHEHLAAGADHVAVDVIGPDASSLPMRECRRLAAAL